MTPDAAPSTTQSNDLPEHFFDMYSLAVEMADRISARRLAANSFFVTVETGLATILGAATFPWYVAIACIVLSIVWWALLRSYRDLNEAKFKIIHQMEEKLPARIYTEEWRALKRERTPFGWRPSRLAAWARHYRELGQLERIVPWVFSAIFVVEFIVSITRTVHK
jgi:hypothetical protein